MPAHPLLRSLFAAFPFLCAQALHGAPLIGPVPSDEPSPAQKAQIERKYGMFCHFGINTYANEEWTDGTLKPSVYDPPADLEQKIDGWVKTAHDAGMRYFLCITKHHDGFCLWDSAQTTYDVGNPEVKNHLDVVKAVSQACRKYGIGFAVYYSLWDRHEPAFADPVKYTAFAKTQLTELMKNYGPVCELWMDGSWVRPADQWHLDEIYDTVKKLQPDCQISTNWTIGVPGKPDTHNVTPDKQKDGYPVRYFPSDFRLSDPYLPVVPDPKHFTHNGKSYYMPFEATVTVSAQSHWFAHIGDTNAKSVDQLQEVFETATAQNNLMVFNIPPDRDGNLVPSQVEAIMELGKRLDLGPDKPFPKPRVNRAIGAKATASATWNDPKDPNDYSAAMAVDGNPSTRWACGPAGTTSASFELELAKPSEFDRVVVSEYADRTQRFSLEVGNGKVWKTVATGTTLGARKEIKFAPVKASQVRLKIEKSADAPSIAEFKVLGPT